MRWVCSVTGYPRISHGVEDVEVVVKKPLQRIINGGTRGPEDFLKVQELFSLEMSRIYDNTPLQSLPVKRHAWDKKWDPKSYFSGTGILAEGTVDCISRHVIEDSSQQKIRYVVLYLKLLRAHRRQFDETGKEVEPNFSQTAKIRTGYLHSSYKVESKGESDHLSLEQVSDILKNPDLTKLVQSERPSCVTLWTEETQLEKLEISVGDQIRTKTKGNSPFVESLARVEGAAVSVANYAGGEQVGGSWTDKVMAVKAQGSDNQSNQPEGVDDDEWDD